MPRYYFHCQNAERLTDEDGTLLANNGLALTHALHVARELVFKRTETLGQPWSAWTLRVDDHQGKTIHSIPMGELPEGNGNGSIRSVVRRKQRDGKPRS